jgi:hypothetical protein
MNLNTELRILWQLSKVQPELGVVVHAYNPSVSEAEARGS